MSLIRYVRKFKEYGIRHSLEIIWQFRIDWLIQNFIVPFVKHKDLENSIIIESHNDFDCNGGAFYQYLIDNGYNEKYKIIWLLKHPENKPEKLPENVECYSLYSPSIKKDIRICTAKYLLADNVVTDKKRKGQISIYCTHGAFGLKNVQAVGGLSKSIDFAISPSEDIDEIMKRQWSIDEEEIKLIHVGFPSEDVFYKNKKISIIINGKEISEYILWMPTFRKGGGYHRNDSTNDLRFGIPLIQSVEELVTLNEILKKNGYHLIIKIHPMQDINTISELHSYSNILVLTGQHLKEQKIDNYEMIAGASALISDYSSSAYTFLHADRPVGIVLSDLNEYKLGLCVDDPDEFIPGAKIITFEDLAAFVDDVLNNVDRYSEKRHDVFNKIYKYHDGSSSMRLANFMNL